MKQSPFFPHFLNLTVFFVQHVRIKQEEVLLSQLFSVYIKEDCDCEVKNVGAKYSLI